MLRDFYGILKANWLAFNPVKMGIFFLYGLFFEEIPAYAGIVNVHNFDDRIRL